MRPTAKLLLAAGITAGVVLIPTTALAQAAAAASSEAVPYLAIAAAAWFALDKIIDLLPIAENTLVQTIRDIVNRFFGKKPQ
jgi:hypothetical protein